MNTEPETAANTLTPEQARAAAEQAMASLKAAGFEQILIMGRLPGGTSADHFQLGAFVSGNTRDLGRDLFTFLDAQPDLKAGLAMALLTHQAGGHEYEVVGRFDMSRHEGPTQ